LALGDFNRDGKIDLVTANSGPENNVSVLLGDGTGSFVPASGTPFSAGTTPAAVAIGDFNRDGIPDLAVANSGGTDVSIFIGNGDGTFDPATPPTVSVVSAPAGVAIGDFNGDGKLDLAVTNNSDDSVSVLLGNGDGTFQAANNFNTGDGPRGIVAADFNRDGVLDLAIADQTDGKIVILLGNGDGTFGPKDDFGVHDAPVSIAVGDFDEDGILDLAVANSGSGDVSVLLGKENGTFGAKTDFPVGNAPSAVVAGDWDGDGNLDLAVTNKNDDNVSTLFGDGAGGFSSIIATAFGSPFTVGAAPSALVAGDFNRDGKLDLAVANETDNNVSILLNAAPPPTVIAPAAGDTWNVGSTQTIRWTYAAAGGFVNVWLSRDGGATWKTILKKTPNDGVQTWKVTAPATTVNNARIRVCTTAKVPVCDALGDLFTIQ
jgi:ankyrin repeat protein